MTYQISVFYDRAWVGGGGGIGGFRPFLHSSNIKAMVTYSTFSFAVRRRKNEFMFSNSGHPGFVDFPKSFSNLLYNIASKSAQSNSPYVSVLHNPVDCTRKITLQQS